MRRIILVLFLAVGLSSARWLRQGRSSSPKETSFVGEATNELTTAIFQGYIDENKNIAFSPLGYSAILAILAEGAKGETREQLVSALHLPSDPILTRKTYKYIMERLKNTNEYKFNQPELKNYFYIYKNYTIEDDYKKILEDYYLTEVRSVERYNSEHIDHDDDDDDDNSKGEFTVDLTEKKPEDKIDNIPELVPPKESDEKLISFAVEDIPEKVEISKNEYIKPAKNIKEKIKLEKTYPKKDDTSDEEETMVAVEARNHARSLKILHDKNDISSSLSVNSVGKKSGASSKTNSLMIIFNGMYFRGSWKHPFESVSDGVFYKSNSKKILVPKMRVKGTFKTAVLPGLDSEAVLMPYDGDRYALLVLVPRSRDGLTRLVADLPSTPLSEIQEMLGEEELCVCMPTFYAECTTKPIQALAKFGVSRIFSRDADLTGVSSDEGLFVQELVQNVAVRVDNADSMASQIGASNVAAPEIEATKNLPLHQTKTVRQFDVDRPFIYVVMDVQDNLIVVAGKIVDPKQSTPFEF